MSKKSVPCYIPNGGEHFIVNLPLGQFTRARLKVFLRELLQNLGTFETMFVAKATKENAQLVTGLYNLLCLDLKPKSSRFKANGKDLGIGGCWNLAVNDVRCGRFAVQLDSDDLYSSPLLAANEKNLKPSEGETANEESLNLVSFAVKCGLILACFLLAAHLEYLQS